MRYGEAFTSITVEEWRKRWESKDYKRPELQRVQQIIDVLARGQPGDYLYITRLEQMILNELLAWTERRSCRAAPPAIAAACGVTPQSASRALRRLGRSHIVLNCGTPRRQNLVVNPNDVSWNFAILSDLRKEEAASRNALLSASRTSVRNVRKRAI